MMKNYSDRIRKRIVTADQTLIQTMKMMDEAFTKLLLVFDDEQFLGIITNGDLQRAIIAHTSFDTPIGKIVSREGKLYAHVGDNRESIKEWMLSKLFMTTTETRITLTHQKQLLKNCTSFGIKKHIQS